MSIIKKEGLVYNMKRRRKRISENVLRFLRDVFGVRSEEITIDILIASIDVCKMIIEYEEDEDYVDNLIDVLEELEELLEFKLGEK